MSEVTSGLSFTAGEDRGKSDTKDGRKRSCSAHGRNELDAIEICRVEAQYEYAMLKHGQSESINSRNRGINTPGTRMASHGKTRMEPGMGLSEKMSPKLLRAVTQWQSALSSYFFPVLKGRVRSTLGRTRLCGEWCDDGGFALITTPVSQLASRPSWSARRRYEKDFGPNTLVRGESMFQPRFELGSVLKENR
jgi:hypothetical protein